MDAFVTWFKLILSYFLPVLIPIFTALGVCGCAPKYIDYAMYTEAGYAKEVPVYKFPGEKIGMGPGDMFVPVPPGNAEVTVDAGKGADGSSFFKYKRSRAETINALKIAALESGDKNLLMYAEQQEFVHSLLDRLDSKLDRFLDLLYQKGQGSLNPGPGTDRLKDTLRELLDELRKQPTNLTPKVQP